jgi:phage terminase large subunit GpA-like protein
MDALCDRECERIVAMFSAQTGKSECLLNIIGYYIHHNPAPILMIQPTLEMAESFSKDRVQVMIDNCAPLSQVVGKSKSRDSSSTILYKKFPGGHVTLAGANSGKSLRSRPVRIILADEVSSYPRSAGEDGDPVNLAIARTKNFFNRKILLVSTPSIKGRCRIETAFKDSDQRFYMVPCPECMAKQRLVFENIYWDGDMGNEGHYACVECGVIIPHSSKQWMLNNGEWVATAPFTGTAGFHLSELYSPWSKWRDIVIQHQKAQNDPEMMKTFINTCLGEPYQPNAESEVTEEHLLAYRSDIPRNLVPPDTARLCLLVDTQQTGFYYQVWAYGYAPEVSMHMVRHGIVGTFEDIDGLINTEFFDHEGKKFRISGGLIDSGGTRQGWQKHSRTVDVYNWCAKNRTLIPHKGMHGRTGDLVSFKAITTLPGTNRPLAGGVKRANIRVDMFKDEFERRMSIQPDDPGSLSFHEEIDAAFAIHFTTEYKDENGDWKHDKKKGRNDYYDCTIYALAYREIIKLRIPKKPQTKMPLPVEPRHPLVRRPTGRKDSFANSWRGR